MLICKPSQDFLVLSLGHYRNEQVSLFRICSVFCHMLNACSWLPLQVLLVQGGPDRVFHHVFPHL